MDWVGDYRNDFGVVHGFARLSVYAVVDGSRSNTTGDFDIQFLPALFQAHVLPVSRFVCSVPETLRHAKAFYAPNAWLHIPIPWPGGTPEFNQFFDELTAIPEVLLAELEGERIDCFWTDRYAHN